MIEGQLSHFRGLSWLLVSLHFLVFSRPHAATGVSTLSGACSSSWDSLFLASLAASSLLNLEKRETKSLAALASNSLGCSGWWRWNRQSSLRAPIAALNILAGRELQSTRQWRLRWLPKPSRPSMTCQKFVPKEPYSLILPPPLSQERWSQSHRSPTTLLSRRNLKLSCWLQRKHAL